MSQNPITPALTPAEWAEWRAYKSQLAQTTIDPVRAALVALQTAARNNDLLPEGSPYKITHQTVTDLRAAADCLESEGHATQADSIRTIASMLFASLGPE